VQKLVSFCSDDLGSFYLDILKDRLYTSGETLPARRAAQSVLHHITHTFMRLIAPILSFTADEIWQTLALGEDKSVFEDVWYDIPAHGLQANRIEAWQAVIFARADAAKEIEVLRSAGAVGSSLQAELEFFANNEYFEALNSLGDELRFVTITSAANVQRLNKEFIDTEAKIKDYLKDKPEHDTSELKGLIVIARATIYKKCERCWHYRADIGSHAEHPTICARCVSNLFGAGEVRKYA
jgi:isoleucyl-tRNA synthetase